MFIVRPPSEVTEPRCCSKADEREIDAKERRIRRSRSKLLEEDANDSDDGDDELSKRLLWGVETVMHLSSWATNGYV